jgi:predicted nucleotidyltransferase
MPGQQTMSNLPMPLEQIADFCRRWCVESLALFGSVMTADFGPSSDVDVLVRFHADAHPTLFSIAQMKEELESLFARPVDLVEVRAVEQSANPVRRLAILNSARVVYAA